MRQEIFEQALQLSEAERAAFLDRECLERSFKDLTHKDLASSLSRTGMNQGIW